MTKQFLWCIGAPGHGEIPVDQQAKNGEPALGPMGQTPEAWPKATTEGQTRALWLFQKNIEV
ncbi:hypothetical protein ABID21_002772 [Pseudorhizobium tarimense]|uniref:Uncharacterized protein n=1 Tax=Pseudorhizobium tarimense TaxID=1079109 RepID=A0ABV2H894_9HYPH